ncbi:MAG: Phosphohydrolase (MutT/nudix family protein) [Candidatus Moranbacteria bacterium GW2011_GWC2_37_8]|nr:MAG: Phosphohydrolase (MutT/nudix family protein) [Candidatus Moranbacteria bacterium GW2011_GWC2_37_8]KKQ62887.1 MAG: mutT-like protein [Parcubacteria group bacterium GW2011_GWC1_38_22]KKQ81483.1 MAG: Phosphohydrolase (MutT/nudix family protein) [Candidatus Moranbacteria bacterium GW2011_GWD2_38_7]
MKLTSKLVVLGIVENDNGEILISQRFEEELPEVHLKWDLPGGKNEFGESLEETLVREILEETGLNVQIVNLLPKTISKVWEYADKHQHTIVLCYCCKLIDGKLHLNDKKINDLKWANENDLDNFEFLPSSREFIEMVL